MIKIFFFIFLTPISYYTLYPVTVTRIDFVYRQAAGPSLHGPGDFLRYKHHLKPKPLFFA